MSKKPNLGKGLGALISQYSTNENEGYVDDSISISKIKPNKNQKKERKQRKSDTFFPRTHFRLSHPFPSYFSPVKKIES